VAELHPNDWSAIGKKSANQAVGKIVRLENLMYQPHPAKRFSSITCDRHRQASQPAVVKPRFQCSAPTWSSAT